MRKFKLIIVILVVAGFFTSCDEYTSPVPAGKLKESRVDTNYVGCWDYLGMDNDSDSSLSRLDPHFMNVVRFDDNRYLLVMVKKDSVKPSNLPATYEATTCGLNGKKIVSIRALVNSDEKTDYLIYLYDINGDTLWYRAFQKSKLDKIFTKTGALKKYLQKYVNDTSVMMPVKKYVRVK